MAAISAWSTQKGWWLGCGLLLGVVAAVSTRGALNYTSSDTFCNQACHAHPHATAQWLQSAHYTNRRGIVAHCTDCHLPPGGIRYFTEKARLGAGDLYGEIFRNPSKIDWTQKRSIARAVTFTYDSACVHCHANLFGQGLSQVTGPLPAAPQQTDDSQVREMRLVARRMEAHLYYQRNRERLRCVNCHLFEGHLQPSKTLSLAAVTETSEFPLNPSGSKNYTEVLPGSKIRFHMIAVPAGTVEMGSPELGACRQRDTGPAHDVRLNPFWMAQTTVTPSELEWFDMQRQSEDKSSKQMRVQDNQPRPVQQLAEAYAQWLSRVTGKQYRLPSEAELEYACVAGGTMPPWNQTDSPAVPHLANVAVLNPWGFADLPDSSRELSLDYPGLGDGRLSATGGLGWRNPHDVPADSTRLAVKFRVVRKLSQDKQASSASVAFPPR